MSRGYRNVLEDNHNLVNKRDTPRHHKCGLSTLNLKS